MMNTNKIPVTILIESLTTVVDAFKEISINKSMQESERCRLYGQVQIALKMIKENGETLRAKLKYDHEMNIQVIRLMHEILVTKESIDEVLLIFLKDTFLPIITSSQMNSLNLMLQNGQYLKLPHDSKIVGIS